MKRVRFAVMYVLFACWITTTVNADTYLVIYATNNGNTGHCGIAIDNHKIRILESMDSGIITYRQDTVQTGTLTYFDLWPLKDDYKKNYEGSVAPQYYKLPSSSWKQLISLRTLSDQGVPHKLGYPCDGIIAIPSTRKQDLDMITFLNGLVDKRKDFSAMNYNCCDFVAEALHYLTGFEINAKEFILKGHVTTPNELYRLVSTWPGIEIVKDPGSKVEGSFLQERIVARIIPFLSMF